jgi:hypothetical protein
MSFINCLYKKLVSEHPEIQTISHTQISTIYLFIEYWLHLETNLTGVNLSEATESIIKLLNWK